MGSYSLAMLNYTYPLFRPPAEANNLILQVTYGCSHNICSFCSMYKSKKYQVRALKDIFADIDILASNYPDAIKLFLADGDALSVKTSYILKILKYIKKSFPKIRRISTYASAQNILSKTGNELKELQVNHLNLIYYGIETGDDTLLKKINKGVDSQDIITSLNMASEANIKISATVILGLGGKEYSKQHISNTTNIINNTSINYLSTLQLGLEDDVKDKFYSNFDSFSMLNDIDILNEQKNLILQINPNNKKAKIIFRSNHASNALHLAGTIPKDKDKLLNQIKQALKYGEDAFIPKVFRGF